MPDSGMIFASGLSAIDCLMSHVSARGVNKSCIWDKTPDTFGISEFTLLKCGTKGS